MTGSNKPHQLNGSPRPLCYQSVWSSTFCGSFWSLPSIQRCPRLGSIGRTDFFEVCGVELPHHTQHVLSSCMLIHGGELWGQWTSSPKQMTLSQHGEFGTTITSLPDSVEHSWLVGILTDQCLVPKESTAIELHTRGIWVMDSKDDGVCS